MHQLSRACEHKFAPVGSEREPHLPFCSQRLGVVSGCSLCVRSRPYLTTRIKKYVTIIATSKRFCVQKCVIVCICNVQNCPGVARQGAVTVGFAASQVYLYSGYLHCILSKRRMNLDILRRQQQSYSEAILCICAREYSWCMFSVERCSRDCCTVQSSRGHSTCSQSVGTAHRARVIRSFCIH